MHPSVQHKWVYATAGVVSIAALFALTPLVFRTQGMMPHGFCITWQPDLIALHAVSDVLIGLAYLSIPVTLLYFVRRRADLPFRGIFLLFGLFIVSCGMTHFIEVWTLWQPYYWLSGVVKAITAVASIATAIALVTLIKPALALPSPTQLQVATANLEDEVIQRRRVESELRLSQTQLEERVAERTRERDVLLAAERTARETAERANRLKDQFLAVVSHELRNPVNAIVGWVNVVRTGNRNGEQLDDALERIERNALSQARLVDDLLDVSRIMTGNLNLIRRTVDLGAVVSAAVDALRPGADAKGVAVAFTQPAESQFCDGDSDRLQQVVANLVGNAIKFTPRNGRVAIAMTAVESEIEIEVRDTGPGIDPQFLPHVFEAFRQADGTSTRRHQGLGLGLSIARDLVLLHGGRVEAGNVVQGGAFFRVYLPATTDVNVNAPLAGDRPVGRLDSVRILIVEDNLDTLEMLTRVLKIAGAVVYPCSNAADATAVALKYEIDIVVTDIGMPDEDGYMLLERLRSLKGQIPAIAVTAFATAADRARSTEAGFQRHFSKPFKPDELIQAIRLLASTTSM